MGAEEQRKKLWMHISPCVCFGANKFQGLQSRSLFTVSVCVCVCVYSSSVIFVVRFPFRCVPSLFIFYLHVWSQFSLLLLLLAFFRSVKMDKNKITKQNRPISVIPLGRGDTGKWHVKTKPNDVSVNERPQRCRTDIPIQLMCVMSPDLAKLPLFILSIVKTQNKSHVRAHNVLQTSYITCSGVTFFFFCLLVGFFSPSLQISLHREIRFARIWSFLRICSPPKKKIWFFMTDDGQQITLLSDLNSATWQLFFGMFTEAICILLSTSSECEVKSFYLYVVWVLNQHRRSSSHQFNSISKAATGQWFYHSGVFFYHIQSFIEC